MKMSQEDRNQMFFRGFNVSAKADPGMDAAAGAYTPGFFRWCKEMEGGGVTIKVNGRGEFEFYKDPNFWAFPGHSVPGWFRGDVQSYVAKKWIPLVRGYLCYARPGCGVWTGMVFPGKTYMVMHLAGPKGKLP